MQHKLESMDNYVEERLVEWARWYTRGNNGGLGYPKTSSITMFMQGKTISKAKRTAKPLPTHERAEEIESFINEMHAHKPLMASAIRLHYLDHLSLRRNAGNLRISHSQFKSYISMGKQWLAGRIRV
jgi:hypothetical protein